MTLDGGFGPQALVPAPPPTTCHIPLRRLHALISFQVYLFAADSTSCDSLLIHKYLGSETQNIR